MAHNARSVGRSTTGKNRERSIEDLISDLQLIVVSNRQPYRHETDGDGIAVDRPTGGLTAGLDPVMQQTGGTWIAWGDGDKDEAVVDSNDCVPVPPDDPGYTLKRVWLSEDQVRDYYYGFSNRVLWPLCHSAISRIRDESGFWTQYRDVNETFAEAVLDRAHRRSLIWFQDYHLALAPKMVRPHLPDGATVMHFWHIPWPAWDTFRSAPHRRELLEGLLGNDILGFHVPRYRTNFLGCVDAALDDAEVNWETGVVSRGRQTTRVVAIPMGVPFDSIQQSADSQHAVDFWSSFRSEHGIPSDSQIGIGVDRLDYTKGLEARFEALERLWESYPDLRGEFTYVQIGSESRSRIRDYQEVQDRVEAKIDRLNDRFETDDWQPVVYVTDHLSNEELHGLYRRADVGIVSPIRDGMNLVAQEYIAAQVDGHGSLVLSDQAGLHDEVGEHVVTITPNDTDGFAESIAGAIFMSPIERRHRMNRLRQWGAAHDLETWLEANFQVAMHPPSVESPSLSKV